MICDETGTIAPLTSPSVGPGVQLGDRGLLPAPMPMPMPMPDTHLREWIFLALLALLVLVASES
jgi:hypothetical protein